MPGTSSAVPQVPPVSRDDERLLVAGGVAVVPAGAAVARRGARHRQDHRAGAAGVECGRPGDLLGVAPGPAGFGDDERLLVAGGGVGVVPAGAAVARRGARHRIDLRVSPGVEGRGAGHLFRSPPDVRGLVDHEGLDDRGGAGEAGGVGPAGATVGGTGTRHGADRGLPAMVEAVAARDLCRRAPGAALRRRAGGGGRDGPGRGASAGQARRAEHGRGGHHDRAPSHGFTFSDLRPYLAGSG